MDLTWKVATECRRHHPPAAAHFQSCLHWNWAKRVGEDAVCLNPVMGPLLSLTSAAPPHWPLLASGLLLQVWNLDLPGLSRAQARSTTLALWPSDGPAVPNWLGFCLFFSKEVGSSSRRLSRKAFLWGACLELGESRTNPSGCFQGCFLSRSFDGNYLNVY